MSKNRPIWAFEALFGAATPNSLPTSPPPPRGGLKPLGRRRGYDWRGRPADRSQGVPTPRSGRAGPPVLANRLFPAGKSATVRQTLAGLGHGGGDADGTQRGLKRSQSRCANMLLATSLNFFLIASVVVAGVHRGYQRPEMSSISLILAGLLKGPSIRNHALGDRHGVLGIWRTLRVGNSFPRAWLPYSLEFTS